MLKAAKIESNLSKFVDLYKYLEFMKTCHEHVTTLCQLEKLSQNSKTPWLPPLMCNESVLTFWVISKNLFTDVKQFPCLRSWYCEKVS